VQDGVIAQMNKTLMAACKDDNSNTTEGNNEGDVEVDYTRFV